MTSATFRRDTPSGISTAVGALVVVVCCAAPPHLDAGGVAARLAVLALGLAAFAAATVDVVAAAVTVGVAFLLFDGFVVGRYGELAWHGGADVVRLGVLAGGAALGLIAGAVRLALQRRAAAAGRQGAALAALPRPRTAADPTAGRPGTREGSRG